VIDQAKLAEAARRANAIAEEHGIEKWAELMDVDINALVYMANQRALRCAMLLIDRVSPLEFETAAAKPVRLSPRAESLMSLITAAEVDGLTIGLTLLAQQQSKNGKP